MINEATENDFGNEGASVIGETLKNNTTLITLDLEGNNKPSYWII